MQLGTELPFYRYAGMLAASMIAWLLPARQSPAAMSQAEVATLAGLQQAIRNQDLLQTRIRALQALLADEVDQPKLDKARTLNEEQIRELKKWLVTILDIQPSGSDEEPVPLVVKQEYSVPVKLEPKEEVIHFASPDIQVKEEEKPIKLEELEAVVPAIVKPARPDSIVVPSSNGNLLSPPMSSSSSSSSAGLETPTPANNHPQSFDLFAPSLASVLQHEAEEEQRKAGAGLVEGGFASEAAGKLCQSPDETANMASLDSQNQSDQVGGEDKVLKRHEAEEEQRKAGAAPVEGGFASETAGKPYQSSDETANMASLDSQNRSGQVEGEDRVLKQSWPSMDPRPLKSLYSEAKEHLDLNGWTTVVSKKHKSRG